LKPPRSGRLLYADDGLIYSNKFKDLDPSDEMIYHDELGVRLNLKKCGYVKRDGEWLKPLTFLGSTYDPWKETLNDIPLSQITPKNF
jgi:hypothetical protein